MTNTVLSLSNVRNYDGNLKINIANGSSLPISVVGDLSSSLINVFMSPNLSTNLLSVGRLVDDNCNVNFSRSGCVVQDQVSEKMIAKGPKVGRPKENSKITTQMCCHNHQKRKKEKITQKLG